MKRIFIALMLCGLLLPAYVLAQSPTPAYAPGKLFVKLYTDLDLELPTFKQGQAIPDFPDTPELRALLSQYQATALFKPFRTPAKPLQKIYELHFKDIAATDDFIAAWQALPYIEYAERIATYTTDYSPNDLSPLQWHLSKIDAQGAWDVQQGGRQVVVAIVDDAVRMDHQDLADQIWTNPGEIPGDSIDNDGNGWIDDVHGYDLAEDDTDPSPPAGANSNDFSHGTHVAGIAAASTDNGIGIASIGFDLSILPCKVKLDSTIDDNELQYTYVGVDYAIATGADVVNMSFGGTGYNATFAYLLSVGTDSGMVFAASAGNTGSYSIQYPAGYPDAISVASTNSSDNISGFSTYHFTVDVSAPGSNIYSCTAGNTGSYGFKSGTSMSAPVVTGLLGLMCAVDSTATAADLRHCLESTTDNIDALNPSKVGNMGTGRINARRAVECLAFPVSNAIPGLSSFQVQPIYPNPAVGTVQLAAEIPATGNLRLNVIDLQGRTLACLHDGMADQGHFSQSLDLHVPAGMYVVAWEWEGQRKVQCLQVLD